MDDSDAPAPHAAPQITGQEVSIGGDVVGRDKIVTIQQVVADLPPAPGPNPFKGLDFYTEDDADLFFGREALTARLVAHVRRHPFLALVGASGSGKSSVARAGLLAALRRAARLADGSRPPAGSADWRYAVLTPTQQPLRALARRLAAPDPAAAVETLAHTPGRLADQVAQYLRAASAERLVLLVDQFEELFTLCHDAAERQAFVSALFAAAGDQAVVVITLRADFYGHCLAFSQLRDALERYQVTVSPMTPAELRRAITEPAARGGWTLEAGLPERLLQDTGTEPGALPLLSHALLETWQRRHGRTLTLRGYAASGGVNGAIARTAQAVWDGLEPGDQSLARRIFVELTELGEGAPDTRRRAALADLRTEAGPQAERMNTLVQALADARLVTVEAETVQVAHEALIREWPTLRAWIQTDRERLQVKRQLSEAAREWDRLDRDAGALYRGVRLAAAVEWARTEPTGRAAGVLESEFLELSQAQADREAQEWRRLYEAAEAQRQEADRQAHLALARQLAAQALSRVDSQSDLAVLLSLESLRLQDSAEARGSLLTVLQTHPRLARTIRRRGPALVDLAWAPSRRWLISLDAAGRGQVWDTDDWRVMAELALEAVCLALRPDGRLLAAGRASGELTVWDLSDPSHPQPVGSVPEAHARAINDLAFSPDGTQLASAGADACVGWWDMTTPARPARLGAPWDEHGRAYAEWRTSTGQFPMHPDLAWFDTRDLGEMVGPEPPSGAVLCVAFSPDGRRLVSGSNDQTAMVWDLVEGRATGRLWGQHTDAISGVAFSPDGRQIVTGGLDGRVSVWDAARLVLAWPSRQLGYPVSQLAFRAHDGALAVAIQGPHLLVFEPFGPEGPHQWSGQVSAALCLTYSPAGQRLVTGGADGGLTVWSAADAWSAGRILGRHEDAVQCLAASAAGDQLASGSGNPRSNQNRRGETVVRVWEVARQVQAGPPLDRHGHRLCGLSFSPDGRWLVSRSADDDVLMWPLADLGLAGQLAPVTIVNGPVQAETAYKAMDAPANVQFTPDGRWLVLGAAVVSASSAWGTPGLSETPAHLVPRLWHVEDRRLVWPEAFETLAHSGFRDLASTAVSGDSRLLAAWRATQVVVWDLTTQRLSGALWPALPETILCAAFSPTADWLAVGDAAGAVRMLNTLTGQMVGQPLVGHARAVRSLAFSPDGRQLITGGDDFTVRLWDAQSRQPIGRPLMGHTQPVTSVVFCSGGAQAASASLDQTVRLWDVDLGSWTRRASGMVGRNLTRFEWELYLPGRPYQATFSAWPLEDSRH